MALVIVVTGTWTNAGAVELNPERPEYYRVVEGDTLWDIAGRFLVRPWEWGQLWRRNPELTAPDLIFPGDVLEVVDWNGEPKVRIAAAADVRLRPMVRVEAQQRAIPTIMLEAIRPFLSSPRPLSSQEIDSGPYIVGLPDRRIVGGGQDSIFVRSLSTRDGRDFSVFRVGQVLRDIDSDEILGYEGVFVADATLSVSGDPATLVLLRNEREAVIGDRVLPRASGETGLYVHPHVIGKALRGHIISVLDGVSQIGRHQVVTLDRGARDGVESGHVFKIVQKGFELRDSSLSFGTDVLSPEQEAGLLIVFRVFDRVSYAFVLEASRPVHIFDYVQNP
jgi:hypothetical protein